MHHNWADGTASEVYIKSLPGPNELAMWNKIKGLVISQPYTHPYRYT